MKLWAGRFSKEVDAKLNDLNSSIRFDRRLVNQDITGSIAHARMLGRCKIISEHEVDALVSGLEAIRKEIEAGKLEIPGDVEDIHTFIEAELTARLGDTGKKLHTARSRNDQVATDFQLYIREEMLAIRGALFDFVEALCDIAKEHTDTIMPGYTHLQRAQPVTFAHHIMAYAQMFMRDCGRISDAYNRADDCPLGAGALAGTKHKIDREYTAHALGFARPGENSMDCVADRDFALEFLAVLSIIMVHLSRLAENSALESHRIRVYQRRRVFDRFVDYAAEENPTPPSLRAGKPAGCFMI